MSLPNFIEQINAIAQVHGVMPILSDEDHGWVERCHLEGKSARDAAQEYIQKKQK